MFTLQLENENANIVDINDMKNYVVLSASGLNPPSATIFTAKSPNRKGVKYNGSTLNERNIVLTIKILGDIEKNRNALYSWVDTEQYVKIHYRNGTKNVYCEGHVQDCTIELFTENETVSLAIICEDPYWRDLQDIQASISMLLSNFVLPFSIDSVGIPFSTLRDVNDTNIFNAGAETGVKMSLHFYDTVKNVSIYDAQDTSRRFTINSTFGANEVIEINTEGSPKTCKLIKPNGTVENILKYVSNNPTWFTLKRGNNVFGYTAAEGISSINLTISFTNKYLGV